MWVLELNGRPSGGDEIRTMAKKVPLLYLFRSTFPKAPIFLRWPHFGFWPRFRILAFSQLHKGTRSQ